jgi:hypothetical protein
MDYFPHSRSPTILVPRPPGVNASTCGHLYLSSLIIIILPWSYRISSARVIYRVAILQALLNRSLPFLGWLHIAVLASFGQ